MAGFFAVPFAAGILRINHNRRAPNCRREGCVSTEDVFQSLRLHPNEMSILAGEYMLWRQQKEGVKTSYHSGLGRVTVFLHYLARGGYYHQLGRTEGLSESATMMQLHSVAAFFQDTAAGYANSKHLHVNYN